MIYAVTIAVVLVAFLLRYRQIPHRSSPDCKQYLRMTRGERVPQPYAGRVLVPAIARLVAKLTGRGYDEALIWTALAGTVASVAVVYALTLHLGGSAWLAAAAAVVLIVTEPLIGCWLHLPMLVDSWSLALAGCAVMLDPLTAAVLLLLAAAAKEIGWAMGAAFIVATDPAMWLVVIPGALLLVWLRLCIESVPGDTESLKHPFRWAMENKRPLWFDYERTLSGLKASPWLAAAVIPGSTLALPVAAVVVLAASQTFIAVDHGRLVAMSGVFVLPALAVTLPEWLVGPWVLACVFWPFKAGWI